MATIGGPATTTLDKAPADLRLTPETYTTLNELVKTTKDFVLPDLVQSYGDQGITGFLNLVGAVKSGGTSDMIDWWESGRRHKVIDATAAQQTLTTGATPGTGKLVIDFGTEDQNLEAGIRKQDVVMDAATGTRWICDATPTASGVVLKKLDGTDVATADTDASTASKFIVLGNMYGQGTEQPDRFWDSDVRKYQNSFMIVKDRYQVNGSQATNIGWVNLGGGEYRWFMYGEQEARKRFEDRREMMLLFGEKTTTTDDAAASAQSGGIFGSQGYVSAVEERGIVISNANANPMDSFAEFDDLILQLDKQGAPSEYAMYLNRKQDLAIDDMLASGIATSVTAGLPGQFGAFNNDSNMAVKLGFKSFTRGGYTFHKHDWKLLNDPTLLGAGGYLQGAMIPLTNVTDARSGAKAPALAMYYKEANGYSREMEHWVTGGGVMGHTNNGDKGADVATFHYRSEIALVTRAANQHVVIKG
jgi:hypothetical protein